MGEIVESVYPPVWHNVIVFDRFCMIIFTKFNITMLARMKLFMVYKLFYILIQSINVMMKFIN